MATGKGNNRTSWWSTMGALKWATIIVPVLVLIALDILRHSIFAAQLHNLPAFVAVYLFIIAGVVAFSFTVFGLVQKLESRIMDQNRHLSALNDIATASTEKKRLEDLLSASLDRILANMKAEVGIVCLVDQEKQEHSAICYRGLSRELAATIQRAKLGDDPVALEVVRTGRPVVLEKVLEDPRVAEAAARENIRSAISAPLKADGQVNGILVIATREERRFSKTDLEALEGIGGQLGLAINSAVLYEHFQTQNRELGALLAVGRAVTASFDLDDMLQKSLDTVIGVTGVDAAEVWLMEAETELALRCHRGTHREAFFERTRLRVGEGLPGQAAEKREPVFCHDLRYEGSFLRHSVVDAGFRVFCAVPLRFQDRLLGVLTVASRHPEAITEQSSLPLLQGIAEWLSLAVENTQLYLQVQDLAVLRERERLAREMHDGMAQLLGYINTQTIAVRKLLSSAQHDDAQEELKKMEEVTRDLYADVREGIIGLRMVARRPGGMLAALREYTDKYTEMSGVQVEILVSEGAEGAELSPSAELQLMRIVQEALTNVRKHSKTTAASVSFLRADSELRVTVADRGQGFDLTRLPSTGWPRFGLQSMRERAEAIGGTLSLDTAPGQGTRVEVRIPLGKNGRQTSP